MFFPISQRPSIESTLPRAASEALPTLWLAILAHHQDHRSSQFMNGSVRGLMNSECVGARSNKSAIIR